MLRAQRAHDFARGDFLPEARFRIQPGFGPHDEVHVLDVRVAIEQEREEDLAQKPGAAHDDETPPGERLGDIQAVRAFAVASPVAVTVHLRAHAWLPAPASRLSGTLTSAITSGGTCKHVTDSERCSPFFAMYSASAMVFAVS